jgi:microcin C transport system substrate-binding protein
MKMQYPSGKSGILRALTCLFLVLGTLACSSSETPEQAAQASEDFEARKAAMLAHMQNHFDTKISLPPEIVEGLERGEISADEIDARAAKGEFEKFFQFKTPADIPTDLDWEDGSDLADIGSPNAKKGGTLYLALSDFPRTLRLFGPDSNGSFRPWILDDTRMGLGNRHPNDTSIDENGNFRYFPGIAQAWAVDPDSPTVYIRINPAARFSDGEPITTDDMMFTFYFFHQTFIQAPWYNNNFQRNYSNITKYDDHTFSLTLPENKPNIFSRTLELEPLPLHFFYEAGEDYVQRYQWRFVPTSGPYVLTDENLKKGRSVTLTRNPDWWAKDLKFWRYRFNPDRVHLTVIRDSAKAFEAFKKGELSLANIVLPDYFYEKLPASDPLVTSGQIHRAVFYNDIPRPTYGLWMNTQRPLLDNQAIRVGINYAINFKKVIDEYFRGDYSRMHTTADGFGEFTHPTLRARPYDVEAALAKFAEAGFKTRGPDGVLVNDQGDRLSFTLTTGYEALQDILTILREEALQAGLELRLEVLDGTASWKKVQEKQHDISFTAFNVGTEMYPRYWETYHSVNAYDVPWLPDGSPNPDRKLKPQTNNLQSLAIAELDRLIEAYRASDDVKEMQQLAFAMEEILHDDGSFVPGFVMPFLRVGYWRWINWPEDFNVKLARGANQYHLLWIDPAAEEETRNARRTGATFEVVDKVFDQYKRD